MRTLPATLVCWTLAAGCCGAFAADPAKAAAGKAQPTHKRQIERLRKLMIENLKDPESARVKGEFLSLSDTSDAPQVSLCGNVNAKNSYGGYGGFERFMVREDGRVLFEALEPAGAFVYIGPVWCGKPL